MIPVLLWAVLCGMALGGVALSFAVFLQARTVIVTVRRQTEEIRRDYDSALEAIRVRIETLHGQLNGLGREAGFLMPRPGLNLSRRSQALRMHRRGDSVEEIAAALEIPRQEVDLLVKVHRIVMSNI